LTETKTPRLNSRRNSLNQLYKDVDQQVERLTSSHAERLRCGLGCSNCCVDDLTVFPIEAENIKHHYPELLKRDAPGAPGGCAFLDELGGCRVYERRPYVCRTQGLPLRWIDDGPEGELVECRDICPLNEEGPAIETLPEELCWSIGPFEERLRNLQRQADEGKLRRVSLRALFQRDSSRPGTGNS
jgi:Fe-S-cluster containining protein